MQSSDQHPSSHRQDAILYLAGAILSIVLVMGIDRFALNQNIFQEGYPLFTRTYCLRTIWSAIAGLLLVRAIIYWTASNAIGNPRHADDLALSDWGKISISLARPKSRINLSFSVFRKSVILWLIVILAYTFLYLFIFQPNLFNQISKEDGIIESLSALLACIASMLFVIAARKAKKMSGKEKHPLIFFIIGMAILSFLIGMEEISWFQRTIDFATPEAFEKNIQDEFNLHNFATDFFEIAYYCGSFIWLVLIPFGVERTSVGRSSHPLALILPSRYILLVSIIAGAYNFDQWNIVFMQWLFFCGWFILTYYWWQNRSSRGAMTYFVLWVIYTQSQGLFLIDPHPIKGQYDWVLTEYREFFIPLSLVVYAGEIMIRIRRKIE